MTFEGMDSGPYDKAERSARKAYELYEDGKTKQALAALERAIEVNPSNSAWHFNKGLTLDAISRFDEAIAEYELALQLSPNDLEILNALAVDYTRTGLYDRALTTFEYIQQLDAGIRALLLQPDHHLRRDGPARHGRADVLPRSADRRGMSPVLLQHRQQPLRPRPVQEGRALLAANGRAGADPSPDQLPHRPGLLVRRGPRQGPRAFPGGTAGQPGDVEAIMDMALFLLETGDLDSAKEKFHRLLEMDPDFAPAMLYLGEIALDQGDPARAADLFDEALKKDPTLAGPHYRLAQCALLDEQKNNARMHLIAELDHEVDDANTLVSMASMFLAIEDPDHASQCLLRAVGLDMRSADAYYYLGVSAANKSQFVDAERFFSRALELDRDHIGALRDSAFTFLAAGQAPKATTRIARARALLPEDCELRMLDYSVRLILLTSRLTSLVCRLDPRPVLGRLYHRLRRR